MKRLIVVSIFILMTFSAYGKRVFEDNHYKKMSMNSIAKLLESDCNRDIYVNCYEASKYYSAIYKRDKKRKEIDKNIITKISELKTKACKNGVSDACKGAAIRAQEHQGSTFIMWSGIILIGIAVLLVTSMIFQDEDEYKAKEKLEERKSVENHGVILKYSRPFFKRYVSPIVSSMKNKKKIKEKYKRPLASAGLSDYLTAEDFFSFKIFLILGFPIVFMGVRAFLEESWSLSLIPVLSIVGFIYPDIWIKGKIQRRQRDVIMAMPFAVDMLALSVEAGLDFVAAMSKVVEKAKKNPLSDEFERMIREIKVGASRAEALRNLAWRIDLIQISSFCATLIAADSVGASIGPILKALSNEIRQKKSAEAEKAGATAATKILFPMMFLIVPAVFIVIATPLIMESIVAGN